MASAASLMGMLPPHLYSKREGTRGAVPPRMHRGHSDPSSQQSRGGVWGSGTLAPFVQRVSILEIKMHSRERALCLPPGLGESGSVPRLTQLAECLTVEMWSSESSWFDSGAGDFLLGQASSRLQRVCASQTRCPAAPPVSTPALQSPPLHVSTEAHG